jgi:hypothetical protein
MLSPPSLQPRTHPVNLSSSPRKNIACSRDPPHISADGCKPAHTAGRPGCPKMRQPLFSSNCTQRTPAGLPFGIPGIGELIEGAVQQAPQPGRQENGWSLILLIWFMESRAGRGVASVGKARNDSRAPSRRRAF